MNIRTPLLRAKVSYQSIINAIVMLVGILLIATGYFGDLRMILYLGLIVTLVGLLLEVVFGVIGRSHEPLAPRDHSK